MTERDPNPVRYWMKVARENTKIRIQTAYYRFTSKGNRATRDFIIGVGCFVLIGLIAWWLS